MDTPILKGAELKAIMDDLVEQDLTEGTDKTLRFLENRPDYANAYVVLLEAYIHKELTKITYTNFCLVRNAMDRNLKEKLI